MYGHGEERVARDVNINAETETFNEILSQTESVRAGASLTLELAGTFPNPHSSMQSLHFELSGNAFGFQKTNFKHMTANNLRHHEVSLYPLRCPHLV